MIEYRTALRGFLPTYQHHLFLVAFVPHPNNAIARVSLRLATYTAYAVDSRAIDLLIPWPFTY